jgi:hypothetical protein
VNASGAKPAKIYQPRDPVPLGRVVIVLLYINIAVELASLVASAAEANVLSRLPLDTPTSWSAELPLPPVTALLGGLIQLVDLVSMLVTAFFVLKWIYRVNMNAHTLATGLTIRPPWAVGWFFVPIAFLFKPYQAMKETWAASTNPGSWAAQPTPGLLNAWWALFLISNFAGNISGQLSFRATNLGMVVVSDWAAAFGSALGLPLNLVFIAMVRRLGEVQTNALSGRVFA